MQKYVSRFHYLTQDLQHKSHLEQVITACESGANWIQYRCFSNLAQSDMIERGKVIREGIRCATKRSPCGKKRWTS